jgi:hypothetical protein
VPFTLDTRIVRIGSLLGVTAYACLVVWVYVRQPRTVAQLTGGVAAAVGAYRADPVQFQQGLRFFRNEQYPESRAAFERADTAREDATTQFYIAYSYYREGWGRLYHDRALFRLGLEAVDRAIAHAAGGSLRVDDTGLGLRTTDELRVELQRGLTFEPSDLNPFGLLERRK